MILPKPTHVVLQLGLTLFSMAMVFLAAFQPRTFWIVLALCVVAALVGLYAMVYTLARFLHAVIRGAGVVIGAFPRVARGWINRVRGIEPPVAAVEEDPVRTGFAALGVSGDALDRAVAQYAHERRDPYVYYALCLFLGEFGAHRFYVHRYASGTFYALTFWTFVPFALAIADLFSASTLVHAANAELRARIVASASQPAAVTR